MTAWVALGDRAFRFPRPAVPARAIVEAIDGWPGIDDVVIARDDVAIYGTPPPDLAARIAALATAHVDPTPGREIELRTVYTGEDYADLPDAAAIHAAGEYTVDMMGFMPGFAYLTGVDPRLQRPRLATPRTRVFANSVGVAGEYTGVYPFISPGGWNLLGTVLDPMFTHDGPRLALGDRVRFVAVARNPGPVIIPGGTDIRVVPRDKTLTVTRALGLVTVQDLGRSGHMHQAVPPGGALVRAALAAANRAVDNADNAPAVEVCGVLRVRAERDVEVAVTREWTAERRVLRAGDELEVVSEPRRAAYLAVAGGIDAPRRLGGRGTLVSADFGTMLRGGARIDIAPEGWHRSVVLESHRPDPLRATPPATEPTIRLVPGPDRDAFAPNALAALCSAPYRIRPDSDRVGTRLDGPALSRVSGWIDRSRPLVRGAIEVPGDGHPIVLGPEHPTTGGYPVIAVVASEDLDALFSVRLGGTVRFTS